MEAKATTVDLAAYFERVGYRGERTPTAEVLRAVHLAHATQIPFENVDVLTGLPIRLDIESLQAKLVAARRGGYCFEQNMLLAAVLEQLGFPVKRLLARVRFRTQSMLPLTHMALEVEAEGSPWLCDVGFGGHGLLEPMPFAEREAAQGIWRYRLRQADERWWVLQAPLAGEWTDLYTLTRERYELVDFEPPNYYVWQHPESIFRRHLIAQRPAPDVRHILVGRDHTELRAGGPTVRTVESDAELVELLAERFGLQVAVGDWLARNEAASQE